MAVEAYSLAELMALDPLELTKDDPRLQIIIEAFRAMRAAYDAGNKRAGSTKSKKGPSTKLNLADIGL